MKTPFWTLPKAERRSFLHRTRWLQMKIADAKDTINQLRNQITSTEHSVAAWEKELQDMLEKKS